MTFVLLVWGDGRGVGGTEGRMAEVISAWTSRGERVVSAMLNEETDTPLCRLLEASGSELLPRGLARLGDLVVQQRPRLVIAFGLRASLVVRASRLIARVLGRQWSRTLDARNGLEAGRSSLVWLVDRCTQRLVDHYVTNSDAAAVSLLAHGIAPDRIRVLYSALGEAWQVDGSKEHRDPASVAMVGNARPEKQQELGLEIFARLRSPARLTVYTNDASALRRQWSDLATTAVGTTLFREGHALTPEDLRGTAVILHPSSHESAPRCLMEGRASGCQVVAFDVGDTRRVVGDGGEVVPPGDSDALLAALERAVEASVQGTLAHVPARFASVRDYTAALDSIGAAP